MLNISVKGNEASIEVVQVTRKVAGPAFRDNRIRASNTFVKEDGEWKTCVTTIINIEFLD